MSLFEALSGSPADENIEKRNSPAVAIFEELLRVFGVFPRNWATDLNLGKPCVMLKNRKILGSFGVMPHKLWGSAYFACYCNICWGVPLAGRPPTTIWGIYSMLRRICLVILVSHLQTCVNTIFVSFFEEIVCFKSNHSFTHIVIMRKITKNCHMRFKS